MRIKNTIMDFLGKKEKTIETIVLKPQANVETPVATSVATEQVVETPVETVTPAEPQVEEPTQEDIKPCELCVEKDAKILELETKVQELSTTIQTLETELQKINEEKVKETEQATKKEEEIKSRVVALERKLRITPQAFEASDGYKGEISSGVAQPGETIYEKWKAMNFDFGFYEKNHKEIEKCRR